MTGPPPDELAPIPTIVVREGVIREANAAVVALVGLPRERIVGQPIAAFLAPGDAQAVVERNARRSRGEAAPEVYETRVVVGGRERTVQVHVAPRGADLVAQLVDVTEQAERRARLADLARLGASVQRAARPEEVWRAAHDALSRAGLETLTLRPAGDGLEVTAAVLDAPRRALAEARIGGPLVGLRVARTPFSDEVWSAGAAFTDDWVEEGRSLLRTDGPGPGPELGAPAAAGVRVDVDGAGAAILVIIGEWLRREDLPTFRLVAAQVSAALDAARSIEALSRRNRELAALNRVARSAATAPDLDAFLAENMAEVANAVGAASAVVFSADRDRREARLLHVHGPDDAVRARMARVPLDETPLGAIAIDGIVRVRHAEDAPDGRGLRAVGLATVAGVPLRFRSAIVGVLSVGFRDHREAADCGTELLQAMGVHFAAALETHRLVGDLRGRVAELTLLNDISVATTTLDPAVLLANALRPIAATFRAEAAAAYAWEGGELLQVAALGVPPDAAARAARLAPGEGLVGQAFARGKTLRTTEQRDGGEHPSLTASAEADRCAAAVPLLAKDRALGAFVLARSCDEPFSEADGALLSALGVQLGVALENARLFADTRRRVSDLEAVNALALKVFGTTPGDAAGLLAAASREIARALSARAAVVLELDAAGERLLGVAGFGTPVPPEELALPLARSALARRALETQEPAWGVELLDGGGGPSGPPALSYLLIPLTSRGARRGLVAVGDVPSRRYSDAEIALAHALASEAAVGLENAALYGETRRRAEELGLLLEVSRALVETLELDRVLDAGVRNLARMVDAPVAALALPDATGRLVIRAQEGADPALVGTALGDPSITALAYERHEHVAVEDAARDPRCNPRVVALTGARGALALPLVVEGRAIGGALIVDPRAPRRFTPAEIERGAAIANQLAVAVEHARLYEDLRRSYADLARAQSQLVGQERLAALGELAAVVAHEVRNPLGVIFNSLGSLRRLVTGEGDARMLLGIVGEEADRLNRIVGALLDFARPAEPALRLEPLGRVLDDALTAAFADGGRRVVLRREIPEGLPSVPMDVRLMRQALLNLTLNAVQAMPDGGTLTVRAAVDGDLVRVEIADTGPGIEEAVRRRMFEPFFTTKPSGSGLGLAVVKRIVDDHRGVLEVHSAPGEGTRVVVRLPREPDRSVEDGPGAE
ncbi:MAG: GAF domain-containing protein [Anaeromyxobacteraceae bacterium]